MTWPFDLGILGIKYDVLNEHVGQAHITFRRSPAWISTLNFIRWGAHGVWERLDVRR